MNISPCATVGPVLEAARRDATTNPTTPLPGRIANQPNVVGLRAIMAERAFASVHQQAATVIACEIIEKEYRGKLTLGGVARRVNFSAGYFSMLMKKATGLNFVDYVARLRVEKAKGLLENPHFRVGEIAFEVGFQSLSQFNRTFRHLVGMPPRDYRALFTKSLS